MVRTPAVDGAPDRLGRVGVRADVGAPACRFLDRGLDLVHPELQALQRIGVRGDAARDHDLDLVGALAQLVAHRPQHFGHAVGDARGVSEAQQQLHSKPGLGPLRKSPWPPVWLIGMPEMNRRGPSNSPLSIAAFMP